MASLKPIKRSVWRIRAGKAYYRLKRYVAWYIDGRAYASEKADKLPYVNFKHQTPLYRELKDVDMQLQRNKVTNLKLAAGRLSGVLVKPGETFSYWRLIGHTTRRKGYVEGMVLFYGKLKVGVGGGLCQLSNLIYWMTLHSPLTVTERYRHSYDVFPDSKRSQPFGSGATCAYNYLDLQITNETSQSYQLIVYVTDTHLVGEWRSDAQRACTYEVYEKDHWITYEHWGGYVRHNTIYRKLYSLEGELIDDEYVTENHAIMMYEPMLGEAKR
ncbi:VanW family protein [Paenibacillus sp. YYML68]|uniref:VanW family protein n=1 Tax=Paenibacillus sp. YYML68 TaxID=2909250 RepID=UPI0024912F65|nr:VanW family protein [Paenibacillus sp. YYML68]